MGGSPDSQTPVWRIGLGAVIFVGLWAIVAPRPEPVTPAARPAPAANTSGSSSAPDYGAHPQEVMAHVRLLVKQTGGDWSRLSPADQQMLNGLTGGHGFQMFHRIAHPERPAARKEVLRP